ncbi:MULTISPECIES: alpha-L-rhamnosidase [Metabacillus]|uniref:alpha-L-rhamnosidase n=2 Tax=Metabacillus TaxID=2675233 RepID=A0A179T6P8_9BACI|nr:MULTISPECIES: alpha-L-rhamnosidase [Metabacillus]OAS89264.1 alpha-L-rhamnosidase [Metabacillus litoralis]QNF28778.1 family 78 glycoside hydrolase catalytic domain [Metabacillus sp. KUDC1714]
MTKLLVDSLKCEYRFNPLGIDVKKPRISWKMQSDLRGTLQKAYRIQVVVGRDDFMEMLWDTGIVYTDESIQIEYGGPDLTPRTRYFYRIKVWDNFDRESSWSTTSWWETGLLDTSEWKAKWITPSTEQLDPLSEPTFLLRKGFNVKKEIISARIYGTGVGLYELFLNGERVGDDLLSPGWTSYHKRLQYQTYDVTDLLTEGSNVVGIVLADGWYKGTLSFEDKRHVYGDRRAALLQLYVTYSDGSEEMIVTDTTWKASTGPILYSEIYNGETYDARREIGGWSLPNFDDHNWKGTIIQDLPFSNLVAQENWPTRVTEVIKPVDAFITPAGDTVIDMGQNMVGRVRFKVSAKEGTRIVLKHAEVLDKEGNIYFGNLGKAEQKIEYFTKGEDVETYAPHFTYQGFRYVKIEGYPGQENGLPLENFFGEVIHSDMELTGEFECSNPIINQLQKNIVWGQRGNFLDLPTDCPQRNERLGWTGDAQVFIDTALFNYHGGPFFTKWLRDLKADQLPDGNVPIVIPAVVAGVGSAAWGDAATIIPWTVYQNYGDKRLLSEQYESMKAWVEYIRKQGKSEYLWNTGFHFGDWLALDAKENSFVGATPKDFIATVFYAYSTRILRDTAEVLEKSDDVQEYCVLLEKIIAQFNDEFVSPSGRLVSPTQTAHVIALMFDLVDGKAKERTAYELNELIIQNNYHLTTGFVGTPYLCLALSKGGYHETAVKLLLQEKFPSWLYAVNKGATTIWEHWDSIKEDGSFWSDQMNSFNHYAYGSIGNWMYQNVAGLSKDKAVPAYKRIRIEPKFAGIELTHAKAAFESMYGRILSSWRLSHEEVEMEVEIPPNTTADILLPYADLSDVLESGKLLIDSMDIITYFESKEGVRLTVGSGTYHFKYRNMRGLKPTYSEETRLIDLLDQKEAMKVLDKYAPGITKPPGIFAMKSQTLIALADFPESNLTGDMVRALIEELNKIEWELVK